MTQKRTRLVVGLGNPGNTYVNTRHNIGFMIIDKLSDSFAISVEKKKFGTLFGLGEIQGIKVILAKPMAFMNRSGHPVQMLSQYFKIPCKDMLVVHDDIDLAFGRIKIKEKGGHGGHNGVRSLIDTFGADNFVRLRVGVGRGTGYSAAKINVSDHVLGRFNSGEQTILDQIINTARDAILTILCKGTKEGMNIFNNVNKKSMIHVKL